MPGNPTLPTENINQVILGLLKIKSGTELDYQTYFKKILNRIAIDGGLVPAKKLPAEESKLLREELKRVKKLIDKGRFVVKEKKVKVSSTPPPKTGAIVKVPKGKLSIEKFLNQPKVQEVNVRDVTEKSAKVSRKKDNPLDRIIKRLDSIIKTLTDLNKQNKIESERQRKDSERKKRKEREESLESKVFDGIKSAVKKMLAPFQSVWDFITNFLWNVFLGKVVLKLLDWFSDPKNKDKIGSIVRFFKDWWPTMLGAYIIFGTSFGKLARTVVGFALKGAIGFGKVIAKLLFAIKKGKGLRVAGAFAGGRKGLGGNKVKGGGWRGAALNAGLAIGGTLLTGFAIDKGVESLTGGDKQNPDDLSLPESGNLDQSNIDVPDQPKIPMLNAASGGLADLGKVLGKFGGGLGGMLGPLGMLMSMGMGSVPEMFQGLVKGKKGTDKIPAMLTDGEFVMSQGAVQKYGVDTLESMNAAGGGTNIPKIVKGVPHAAGGGLIGGEDMPLGPKSTSNTISRLNNIESSLDDLISANRRGIADSGFNLGFRTAPSHRMLPSAGQSSANAMRAAAKTARVSRPPIPTSSSIVPYSGGGLARTGVTGGLSQSIPQIRTNMNVPGGRIRGGSLSAVMAALEMKQRMDEGQTSSQAGLGAGGAALGGQLGWMGGAKAGAVAGAALGSIVPGLGTVAGAGIGAIAGGLIGGYGGAMAGGKIADDFSGVNAKKERATRGVGGDIVGGYGLKGQSFKDAPKTSIITDDKGRPYVGHKALKNGKLTYVRKSTPGTGTTNPLEMFGRFINPDAYKQNDAKIAMKDQKIAMVNALESMQSQGMAPDAQARMMKQMGGNLKDVQNDLNYRKKTQEKIKSRELKSNGTQYTSQERMRMSISRQQTTRSGVKPPPPKPAPKPQVAGGGMGGKRGGGVSSPGSVRPVAASRKNTAAQKRQYGINK